MHTGDQKLAQMPPVDTITADGRVGAKVLVGDTTYEVAFATAGAVAGHIKISQGDKVILDRDLAGTIEDNCKKWSADSRYKTWMTESEYKSVIGAD
jgi:hypothetical protein